MRHGVVFVLLLALAPGVGEVLENAVHLLTQGHWAHARLHGDDHYHPGPEHGCSGPFHVCSCHHSLAGSRPAFSPRAQAPKVIATLASPHAGSTRSGFHHVPERPPRA